MLARLHHLTDVQQQYLDFLSAVAAEGFQGELCPDYANRTVLATDNSIYQVLPQAVVYPACVEDIQTLTRLAATDQWQSIVLSPRGGGTGTNGQSLTDGIVVDLSKHMNRILEINPEERWVRVQTGVVKDQLNAALKPYGLFFAPELSTSNRATIGGMINTDASGQGSVLYGKTRDHVLSLETILLSGDRLVSGPLSDDQLLHQRQSTDRIGQIHATVDDIYQRRKDDIAAKFPPLNRCLTGYDLAHIYDDGQFNLNNILCGSEGTLGFITEAKLNVLPIPKVSALVNVFYDSFESSLRDAQALMGAQPTSIETIDSTVLELAQGDIIWHSVSEFFDANGQTIKGINLVEYTADSQADLQAGIDRLTQQLAEQASSGYLGHSVAMGTDNVKQIWAMRKKSVGLLGNAKGEARPIPFVEDTAVPPENLADFIMEFRAVLDHYNLRYGMFGHVDAGVLHVRPALDQKDPAQMALVRTITDQVVELIKKYNGLLWGEHGKGLRSEFAPEFFGDLYPELQAIKRAFDPFNQLNPGKIATHHHSIPLIKIDEATTRGELDRTISLENWTQFGDGMYCNGNGACFNYDPADAMCPSWKATRERKHSPKGRASLIREWLRLLDKQGQNTVALQRTEKRKLPLLHFIPRAYHSWQKARGQYDFNHEVAESMAGCLACKSCTGQCPIKVDVPEFRARFLQLYYSRYLRPLKDYFIGMLEFIIPLLVTQPFKSLYNTLMRWSVIKAILKSVAGMVDSPLIHPMNFRKELRQRKVMYADANMLQALSDSEKNRSVIIVQDAFTSFFETHVVMDIVDCLQALGFRVWMMPYAANGKPLHVHGFLHTFRWIAQRNQRKLKALADCGIALVGIDPSMTLTYRAEYAKYVDEAVPRVDLLQEFLVKHPDRLKAAASKVSAGQVGLLGHCTEKTNAASSIQDWVTVLGLLNQQCRVIPVGCCGMAGTYGHETRNRETSEAIYDLSWREVITTDTNQETLVTTGYSCRSQVKRLDQQILLHPLQQVLTQLIG
ncbi:FAD-binding and (Fe-S)-binding domain-containing protein [Reinekea blandensis]|uniref:D-2-hydroxyglutarate dehydrogenase n=1 Tax=Reinekea blandensis MED297 TaxID=314283 RepID=A4BC22_9GAMM|nr:FAD-binding and (Fe-S)-binding domain-containing protein [Reinekea blandensis]EAR10507.1 oxidoreductase, FAD-binding, putative [Reinekea sp. MED297] [Reinekea blandensis MED297]